MGKPREKMESGSSGGWRRVMLSCLLVVAVAGTVASLGWVGFRELWSHVIGLKEFQVQPARAQIRIIPEDVALETVSWLKAAALRRDLVNSDSTGVLGGSWSIFAPGLARKISEALRQSPWVQQVVAVKRRFPNLLEIHLFLRKPFGIVQIGEQKILIDREQVVLSPMLYHLPRPGEPGYLPIVLQYKAQPPAAGRRWAEEGVTAGVETLALLHEKGALEHVELDSILVSRVGWLGEKKFYIELRARSGAVVKWGNPPFRDRVPSPEEVPQEKKIAALLTVARAEGRSLPGIEYVDVRWDRPVIKRKQGSESKAM